VGAKRGASPVARKWTLKEHARNIHVVDVDLPRVGDEFWALLQSDVHWDNPKCDRDTFVRHLEEAREKDAPVFDNGDFYCAMQGKWDARSNKNDLRPEHQHANYLDTLIDTAVDALKPYRDLLCVRGMGNHETSIIKRHETNLTERFVERMRSAGSSNVKLGGYSGYLVFQVSTAGRRRPLKLHYHHGYGGGGPVTRGVIQTNRMAVYVADADMVWTGHTHDAWQMPIARVKLNQDNTKVEHTTQLHFRTAGYKEEYGDGYGGWHVERGGPPKPVGAAWLRIRYAKTENQQRTHGTVIDWDIFEAK
jgi:hypothetical protein